MVQGRPERPGCAWAEGEAEAFEALAAAGPDAVAVLPDPDGEHQRVQPAQRGPVARRVLVPTCASASTAECVRATPSGLRWPRGVDTRAEAGNRSADGVCRGLRRDLGVDDAGWVEGRDATGEDGGDARAVVVDPDVVAEHDSTTCPGEPTDRSARQPVAPNVADKSAADLGVYRIPIPPLTPLPPHFLRTAGQDGSEGSGPIAPDLGFRSGTVLGRCAWLGAVAPSVAPNIGQVIPNPRAERGRRGRPGQSENCATRASARVAPAQAVDE